MMWNYLAPEDFEKAKANGISENALRVRYYNGWTRERAINQPMQQKGKYSELLKAAKENGISSATFASRLHRGMTPEEAATARIITKKEKAAMMNRVKAERKHGSSQFKQIATIFPEQEERRYIRIWKMKNAQTAGRVIYRNTALVLTISRMWLERNTHAAAVNTFGMRKISRKGRA